MGDSREIGDTVQTHSIKTKAGGRLTPDITAIELSLGYSMANSLLSDRCQTWQRQAAIGQVHCIESVAARYTVDAPAQELLMQVFLAQAVWLVAIEGVSHGGG